MVGGDVMANTPAGVPAFQQSSDALARTDKATTTDYLGSMYRQDSLIDGTVAAIVGRQLMPDANYSVHEPATWKELTQGINPEFHSGFYDAHSPAHASMIRDRILEKQEDLIRLGDMGLAGNIARIGASFLMPDQLALMAASGGVSGLYKAGQIANATRLATTTVGKATAVAGLAADTAKAASSARAIGAGIVFGGASNAAFEAVRQNVSFEDSNTEVVIAGLLGAAITAPFSYAGAKAQSRIATAAAKEHEVFKALKLVDEGQPLTADQAKLMKEVVDSHRTIREMQLGIISPEEGRLQMDSYMTGPQLEDAAWLDRYSSDIRAQTEMWLDQQYPDRVIRRTSQQFNPDGQPLALGYDPTAGNGPFESLRVDSRGNVAPALDFKTVEAELDARAKKLFPKDAAKRNQYKMDQRTEMAGYESPSSVKRQMQERIKARRAEESQAKKDGIDAANAERARNVKANETLQAQVEKNAGKAIPAQKITTAAKNAADRKASDAAFEAQIQKQFELSDATDKPDTTGPDMAAASRLACTFRPPATMASRASRLSSVPKATMPNWKSCARSAARTW